MERINGAGQAPAPHPAKDAAGQPAAPSAPFLPGTSIDVQVLRALSSGRFLLALGDREFVASSSAPLQPGSQVRMTVAAADADGVVLRLEEPVRADVSAAPARLAALRLPATAAAAAVLAAFEDAGAPLDPVRLQAAVRAAAEPQAPATTARAHALLARSGLPISPALVQVALRAAEARLPDVADANRRSTQPVALPDAEQGAPAIMRTFALAGVRPQPAGRTALPSVPATTERPAPSTARWGPTNTVTPAGPGPAEASASEPAGHVPTAKPDVRPAGAHSGSPNLGGKTILASPALPMAPSAIHAVTPPVERPLMAAPPTSPKPAAPKANHVLAVPVVSPAPRAPATTLPMPAADTPGATPLGRAQVGASPAASTHSAHPTARHTGVNESLPAAGSTVKPAVTPDRDVPPHVLARTSEQAGSVRPVPEFRQPNMAPPFQRQTSARSMMASIQPPVASPSATNAPSPAPPTRIAVLANAATAMPPPAAAVAPTTSTLGVGAAVTSAASPAPASDAAPVSDLEQSADDVVMPTLVRQIVKLALGAALRPELPQSTVDRHAAPAGPTTVPAPSLDLPGRQLALLPLPITPSAEPANAPPVQPMMVGGNDGGTSHAVREHLAEQVFKAKELADYDRVVPLPLATTQTTTPARLAVATRTTGGGAQATFVRVDADMSRLGPVSLRLSGTDAGGPLAITLVAGPAAGALLAEQLPALIEDLRRIGVDAAVRVVSDG